MTRLTRDDRQSLDLGKVASSAYGARNALSGFDLPDVVHSDANEERIRELEAEREKLIADLEQARQYLETMPNQTNALLTQSGNGQKQLGRFTLTPTSLIAPENVSGDELNVMAEFIRDVNGSLQFWIGDLINLYFAMYGNANSATINWLSNALDIEGVTLQQYAFVCKKFPQHARAYNLKYMHFREVAFIAKELESKVSDILAYASENKLSTRDLQMYIKSLLPPKALPKGGLDTLLSKERAPNLGNLRKLMSSARSGDAKAKTALRKEIDTYRAWLKELAESAGLE